MTSPAEIAELVKALEVLADIDDKFAGHNSANLHRAAAALEEVGKDAQRYRWLRFNSDNEFTDREDETPTLIAKGARFSCIGWDEKIDKAIDAAIDTEKNA